MVVFIEYALIDNLVMDYLLLKLTNRLMRIRENGWLTLLGAGIGTAVALILPLFRLNKLAAFLIKIVLAMLITLVAAKHKSAFDYFKFFNVFLLATFAVGGAIIGVLTLMGVDYSVSAGSGGVLPVGVNLLAVYLLFVAVKKTAESVQKRRDGRFVCDCFVKARGRLVRLVGYIDTGNVLIDAYTNLPVVVCSESTKNKIFGIFEPKPRFMPISTAGGISFIELYDIDGITVVTADGKKLSDAVIGVTREEKKLKVGADLIIGAALV